MAKPIGLTVLQLKALTPREQPYEVRDEAVTGGYVTVRPSGVLSYIVRYRFRGASKKLTLGAFNPDAGGLSKVRALARAAQNDLATARHGAAPDPATAKRAQRKAAEQAAEAARLVALEERANTFGAVASDYMAAHGPKLRPNTRRERARQIDKELARWRDTPITAIGRRDVFKLLDAIAARGPIMANRIFATLTHLFTWCEQREIIITNPMKGVPKPAKESARERVLDDDELAIVWRAASILGFPYGPFYKAAILTGARRSELSKMTWAEVDLDAATWSLGSARTKNAQPLERPLPPMAVALLRSLPRFEKNAFVFGSPLSAHTVAKQRLDKAILDVNNGRPLPSFVVHDLRRTYATGLQRLSVKLEVTERLLGHIGESQSGIRKIYQRHSFTAEKIEAARLWGAHVQQLTGEPTPAPSNVIELATAKVSA